MADAVLLLAGGKATRFPGKLAREIDGEPMLLRVYRRLRAAGLPMFVAAQGTFPGGIDAQLDCPLLIDREPDGGPLAALCSACGQIGADRVFAIAADQPQLGTPLLEGLAAAWRPGDEAVVPHHGGRAEPLAALYARSAVLREGFALLRQGKGAMHALIERLRARLVTMPDAWFANVNMPADLEVHA
jgi:molybdopterin-guanine dinucleotide biosynthesis protein A